MLANGSEVQHLGLARGLRPAVGTSGRRVPTSGPVVEPIRDAFEDALEANGKSYVMHMYDGANHGFHNDTTPRYDEDAATLAQERTMAFFNEHLR